MNKFPKRVLFISMLLIVNILMLASCKSKDIYDDENLKNKFICWKIAKMPVKPSLPTVLYYRDGNRK